MTFPLSEAWFHPPSHPPDGPVWRRLSDDESAGQGAEHAIELPATELGVVEAIRAGDHAAFRTLYESSLDVMLRFAYTYVRSAAAAQDVVADVFVALWERRETWRPARGIRPYLLAAVRNRALDGLRHEHVIARVHDGASAADIAQAIHAAPPQAPDAALDLSERRARLEQAMRTLSPDRRRALMLRWHDGLSPVEIAAAMGIPRAAVDQLVSRAIKTLRASVGE